jgi:hypothetical protein
MHLAHNERGFHEPPRRGGAVEVIDGLLPDRIVLTYGLIKV